MKILTLLLFVLSAVVASAQLPVSQVAGKKNALIEEFTGINCPNCPGGHAASNVLTSGNPTHVFSVNVHPTGSNYTTPSGAQLDFRNLDGDAIRAIPTLGTVPYPSGTVNRAPCASPYSAGGLVMTKTPWTAAVATILSQNAYVNIAGEATFNAATRVLTVKIEAYYTANGATANNLTVMLKQDNIIGYQSGGGAQYNHMHALRAIINAPATGAANGPVMGATTAGTTYTTTISYTIPTAYKNIPVVDANLNLIAFVSEGATNIINVCKVPMTITSATSAQELPGLLNNVSVFPNPTSSDANVSFNLVETNNVSVALSNMVGQTIMTKDLGQMNVGLNNFSLNASDLQNGLYLLSITVGTSMITKTVSIEK